MTVECPHCGYQYVVNPGEECIYCHKEMAGSLDITSRADQDANMKCPKCGTEMEEGFILMWAYYAVGVKWSPKKNSWGIGGTPFGFRNNHPASRCPSCGTLVLPPEEGRK